MTSFVEIAVNVPRVLGVFHYHLPASLQGQVQVGHLVEVEFGKQVVQGVVLGFIEEPEVPETKPVRALVDTAALITTAQIDLAQYLADSTLASLASCVGLMLPAGLSKMGEVEYSLTDKNDPGSLNKPQARLVALLQKRGSLRTRQLDRVMPARFWRPAINGLIKEGRVQSRPVLAPPSVRPKYVRTAQLAASPEVVAQQIDSLSSHATVQERRRKIMDFLLREPEPVEVAWVYAESGGNLADLKYLAKKDLVLLREKEIYRDPLAGLAYDPSQPPALTADQQTTWIDIQTALQANQPSAPFLLHGVTGSGKTEIYLRAVAETLRQDKQAIVLVPEIALTPQTVRRFMARFPGQVGLLHSQLSDGERYDTWRRARTGSLPVIIGPRSALFAPLPNIGLIVVDESHDDSYYQGEITPHYHAREAAAAYAKQLGAVCVFGSATPDITSMHRAKQGTWQLLELPSRIMAHTQTIKAHTQKLGIISKYQPAGEQAAMMELPPVRVVDMRAELRSGNSSIFSQTLQDSLEAVLERGEQAILFLNRRGTATYVFCRDCGEALHCPRCDNPLTYHERRVKQAGSGLVCHHCGYTRQMPKTCPNCGSHRIRQYGMGTERVEAEVQARFPLAQTLRWDFETTRKKGTHEIILSHFANQHANVLIGTQMLAKGLDLPLVTLVGVVLADVGLHMPDYRAGERVFQVLSQVAGRAGRSPLGGEVVLQTFHPDHYVIEAAAGHDYAGFYQTELDYRRELGYPPFTRLVRMEYRHTEAARAEAEAGRMAAQIKNWLHTEDRRGTEMIGPAPCFYARLGGAYRWQIILRGPNPASLLADRNLGDWRIEVNPQALL